MKHIAAIVLLLILGISSAANAQTFLDRLKKAGKNQGTVTVRQDAAIDELVNGKAQTTVPATIGQTTHVTHAEAPSSAGLRPKEKKQEDNKPKRDSLKSRQDTEKDKTETAREKKEPAKEKHDVTEVETDVPVIDTRKKVMRQSYKINGYRVQAFAGGNTRNDRLKAERIGNDIKKNYPDQPIYVHFYSPRWICRVGNYRSYEEAHKMLMAVHKMGYRQATIVKGKISIQY